jgi:uncharacterized protein YgiM (DUF1202 family)
MVNSRLPKMKTFKIVLIIIASVAVLSATSLLLIGYFNPKPGGLLVDTVPSSSVFINGNFVGKTPYRGTNTVGQISLKLVPEASDRNLIAYETKVGLVSGIETVVRREFGESEEESSGDVISFEKTGGDSSGLVVVSSPDNAQVLIDGFVQGFTPYSLGSTTIGNHNITVNAPGYIDKSIGVKTRKGYKLTIFVKLAKSQEVAPSPSPSISSQTESKTYVVIGETPTGFLRMRTKPGTTGEEIAELTVGSKYLFIETDIPSGWYKIQYKDPAPGLPNGITGWVSNQYVQISTESGTLN